MFSVGLSDRALVYKWVSLCLGKGFNQSHDDTWDEVLGQETKWFTLGLARTHGEDEKWSGDPCGLTFRGV